MSDNREIISLFALTNPVVILLLLATSRHLMTMMTVDFIPYEHEWNIKKIGMERQFGISDNKREVVVLFIESALLCSSRWFKMKRQQVNLRGEMRFTNIFLALTFSKEMVDVLTTDFFQTKENLFN